ncbi:uncharacterized protein ACWYII_017131 [Salvelinus alpinus]
MDYRQHRTELKARAAAFKEQDSNPEAYKKSRYALRRTIKQAKPQYRTKIESYYNGSNARRMWQGLQTITDYRGKHSRELPSDTSIPDELNYFYARFEANNTETCMRAPAVLDDCVLTLSAAERDTERVAEEDGDIVTTSAEVVPSPCSGGVRRSTSPAF